MGSVVPKEVAQALTPEAKKLWHRYKDEAAMVEPKLLIHFAAYLNLRAEYEEAIKRIEKMKDDGVDSFVAHHKNGTMGLHPLRAILDKARRGMADELKRCGITLDRLEDEDDDNFDEALQ